jgi:hypothetical protein
MPTRLSFISYLTLGILVTISQIGCVALNIPSERLHDPADHGGILGDWKTGGAGPQGACSEREWEHPSRSFSELSIDGGPLECDPLDPSLDQNGNPKKDEVPWPLFHPVPTRPVFGGPTIQ